MQGANQTQKAGVQDLAGKANYLQDLHQGGCKEQIRLKRLESKIWQEKLIICKIYIKVDARSKSGLKSWNPDV